VPAAPDLTGRALDDRYELHAVIGEGAFGRVYRGFDRRLARTVAVKVIKPWWAEDTAWVERFQREAQLLARVSDPGIVQIYDIGHAKEGPYYVAELVEGESLAERLQHGALPAEQATDLALQLCDALASAHAQGVVHCDVKPANVLLARDGSLKVGDFGVARLAGGTSQALSVTVAGTPRYMSPEQARGRPTSAATDVYSTGVVMYEMLAGDPPFVHGSAVELGLRHLQDLPAPLPGSVPAGLRRVVERALSKDPQDRWQDGAQMAAALRALSSDPAPVVDESGPDGAGPDSRQTRAVGGATVVMDQPATITLASRPDDAAAAASTHILGEHQAPTRSAAVAQRSTARSRRRRRIALAALLALCAGAIVAVLLTDATAHTTVPELTGLPRGGVEARARRLDVSPTFLTSYSETARGTAIAQYPAAGSRVADGSTVRVTLSAGPPPVRVPSVVGEPTLAAQSALAGAGLRWQTAEVAAPGTAAGTVASQLPAASQSTARGSVVKLNIAETPTWHPLTTFSGAEEGQSVVFRILGSQWRVAYSVSYQGTCMLIFVCSGPSAQVQDIQAGNSFGSFELNEGTGQTHTFNSGPGLYRVNVSSGRDSAHWTMTVDDYY
jgi:serine/threonine-protein kinase